MRKRIFLTLAPFITVFAAMPTIAQVTGDVNVDVTVQVEPSLVLTLDGDLVRNVSGDESGNVISLESAAGNVNGVSGCLTAPPGSVTISVDGVETDAAGQFALSASGVTTKIAYSPLVRLRTTGGSFTSVANPSQSGENTTVDLTSFDVDGSDCSSKPENIQIDGFIVNNTFAASANSGGMQYVINEENLDDGVARQFADVLTITVTPVP